MTELSRHEPQRNQSGNRHGDDIGAAHNDYQQWVGRSDERYEK
jgi:hypothetical protein